MRRNEEIKSGYCMGRFLGEIVSNGIIHPDLQLSNIGFGQSGLVILDYADAEKIKIPDELSSHIIDRFSSSIFPLIDEFPDYTSKSSLITGFSARGGILADIILSNCRNSGFLSFEFLEQKPTYTNETYTPEQEINNQIVIGLIKEWCENDVDRLVGKNCDSLVKYGFSPERSSISSANRYYLDRHYYAFNYCMLPDDQLPSFYANTGCSAYKHDHKYRAYGLLKKALPMLTGKWAPMYKFCKTCLNSTIHMKKMNPEYKNFIDEHLDMNYYELSWILDDFDSLS